VFDLRYEIWVLQLQLVSLKKLLKNIQHESVI
jgi:hypothetical protein